MYKNRNDNQHNSKKLICPSQPIWTTFLLFYAIIDLRTDNTQIKEGDAFIHTYNGKKRRRYTTKGWEIHIKWKYGSSTWNKVKDVKESFPVQLAEYKVLNQIADEPEFE